MDTPFKPSTPKSTNIGKIVGGIVAVAAILVGICLFGLNESAEDQPVQIEGNSEQVRQTVDKNISEVANIGDTVEESSDSNNDITEASSENSSSKVTEDKDVRDNQLVEKTFVDKSAAPSAAPKQETKASITKSQTTQVSRTSAPVGDDVIENARRVIRGDFGNGQERKDKLGSAYPKSKARSMKCIEMVL